MFFVVELELQMMANTFLSLDTPFVVELPPASYEDARRTTGWCSQQVASLVDTTGCVSPVEAGWKLQKVFSREEDSDNRIRKPIDTSTASSLLRHSVLKMVMPQA